MSDMINRNYIWVYEREGGDCGIVIASTYGNALDELRKMYSDIDERLNEEWREKNKWQYGLSVYGLDHVDHSENGRVLVTMPY